MLPRIAAVALALQIGQSLCAVAEEPEGLIQAKKTYGEEIDRATAPITKEYVKDLEALRKKLRAEGRAGGESEELIQARRTYGEEIDKATAPINKDYIKLLESLKGKLGAEGKAAEALAVQEEIDAVSLLLLTPRQTYAWISSKSVKIMQSRGKLSMSQRRQLTEYAERLRALYGQSRLSLPAMNFFVRLLDRLGDLGPSDLVFDSYVLALSEGGKPEPVITALADRGDRLLLRGAGSRAFEHYSRITSEFPQAPGSERGWYGLAKSVGDRLEKERYLRHVCENYSLADGGTVANAHYSLGSLLFNAKRYDEAIEVMTHLAEKSPRVVRRTAARLFIAHSYRYKGDTAKATAAFREITQGEYPERSKRLARRYLSELQPPARVVHVTVGDTLKVRFRKQEESVRLLGIDAPERGERGHDEAKDALAEMVGKGRVKLRSEEGLLIVAEMVDKGKVEIRSEEGRLMERDCYRRLLAYVYLFDGRCANVEMVRLGWSKFCSKDGRGRLAAEFEAAEREAREAKRGLWRDEAADFDKLDGEPE